MSQAKLNFSRAEFDQRLMKTRQEMQQRGIDLLIVSDPSNMNWLTGYDGWSFYVHQCVILPLEGAPIWYGRGQDAKGARAGGGRRVDVWRLGDSPPGSAPWVSIKDADCISSEIA